MSLVIFFLSFSLYAVTPLSTNGNGVGNGGDVVRCKNDLQILDFEESRILSRYKVKTFEEKNYIDIINIVLLGLKRLDPKLSDQYQKTANTLSSRLKYIENAEFRDVPDSFEVALPESCRIEQAAIQQKEAGKTMIHISKKIWDALDPKNKAGLILHEIIYEHFIVLGDTNSIKARRFTSFLFSEDIKSWSKEKYQEILRENGIKLY